MSTTLNLNAMIADVQNRIPMNLTSPYITDRLNESFRWIAQQDSFVWALRRTTVTVNNATMDFPLPTDADPGDPMALYGGSSTIAIPYIPFEKWSQQVNFNQPLPGNTFSAWTVINTGSAYIGKLATNATLSGVITLNLFYHQTAVPVTNGAAFFPSPDEFDSLIVDLTEAEIKRRYNIAGWDSVQQKATESAKKLIDAYRSSKRFTEGMSDLAANAQEASASRAE